MEKTQNLPEVRGPSMLIEMALSKGADEKALEKLEKVLELQERWEANEAKKAYHQAMSAFKLNPPDIERDKTVSYTPQGKPTVTYNHATLANVTGKINASLSEHGLSASWVTKQENGSVSVTCKITHSMGHSEETTISAAPDTSGSKNPIQAIGSTISYLERYTILALTGLATHDMDDDGKGAESIEFISAEQKAELVKEIAKRRIDVKKFNEFLKVGSIDELPAKRFNEAMKAAQSKPMPTGKPEPPKEREPGEDDDSWMEDQGELV